MSNTRAEFAAAWELATQCSTLIQSGQNRGGSQVARYMLGEGCFHRGELAQARAYLEEGLALYAPQHPSSSAWNEPRVACLCIAAYALWALGYPDQALQRCHEALTFAQEFSHPFSLAFALYGATRLHQCRREVEATQEYATTLIALSTEHRFAQRVAVGRILQGWALAEQGQGEEGSAQIRQGLAAHHATGAKLYRPYFLSVLAEACGKAGQADEGLTALIEAFTAVDTTGERSNEAELHRLKGQLTLQKQQGAGSKLQVENSSESGGSESEVEECFWQAIEIARHQQAKSLELRAAMSLCCLWQQQGKHWEAYELLAPVYGWFTEGFDTADLQEAKALLDELS